MLKDTNFKVFNIFPAPNRWFGTLFSSSLKTDSGFPFKFLSQQPLCEWNTDAIELCYSLLQNSQWPSPLSKAAIWVNVNLILCSISVITLWCQQSWRTRQSSDVQTDFALRHADNLHSESLQIFNKKTLLPSSLSYLYLEFWENCQRKLPEKDRMNKKVYIFLIFLVCTAG